MLSRPSGAVSGLLTGLPEGRSTLLEVPESASGLGGVVLVADLPVDAIVDAVQVVSMPAEAGGLAEPEAFRLSGG